MKPKMRQKVTRQKSTRQKAIRRTYKKVKGGNPFILKINWSKGNSLFGFFNEKGDSDKVIFDKINTYLDMIETKLKTYADETLLIPNLEEANKAINQFEIQRFQMHHRGYDGGNIVLQLRRRAFDIRKRLQKATSGQTEENKGKLHRAGLSRFLQERRQNRRDAPRVYKPPNEYWNKLHLAPMERGNNSNRNEFNTMMRALEQQKAAQNASAHNAAISPSQKSILNAL